MPDSYIYVIGSAEPPFKVGISKNPKKRLRALQTGCPNKLQILATKPTSVEKVKLLETIIHRNLNLYKTQGEWFNLSLEKILLEIDYALIRYEEDPLLHLLAKDKILFNRFR